MTAPPTTYLIDPSGRITVEPETGPATEAELQKMLEQARKQAHQAAKGPVPEQTGAPAPLGAGLPSTRGARRRARHRERRVVGEAADPGARRAASIEAVVRCPSCIDVSVAQSEESTALAVRHEIERQVAQGRSTAQIEQTLVDQYGQTILLEPPDSGGFAIIWIVPIVLGAGALGVIGVLFWRRSRQFSATRRSADAGGRTMTTDAVVGGEGGRTDVRAGALVAERPAGVPPAFDRRRRARARGGRPVQGRLRGARACGTGRAWPRSRLNSPRSARHQRRERTPRSRARPAPGTIPRGGVRAATPPLRPMAPRRDRRGLPSHHHGSVILVDHAVSPSLPGQRRLGQHHRVQGATDRAAAGRSRHVEQQRRGGPGARSSTTRCSSEDPTTPMRSPRRDGWSGTTAAAAKIHGDQAGRPPGGGEGDQPRTRRTTPGTSTSG